jgi:hypothetical protein
MASDEEIERRLRELKGGGALPPAGPSSASGTGGQAGPRGASSGTALEGDIIEPVRDPFRARTQRSATAGRAGAGAGGAAGRGGAAGAGAGGPGGAAGSPPAGVGTRVIHWSLGEAIAGRLGLWIGAALVVVGAYYILAEFVPGIRVVGSLGVAVVGGVILVAGFTGRAGTWARTMGAVLVGFGVLPFVAALFGLGSSGWGSLGAGVALLLLGLAETQGGHGAGWRVYAGLVLAVWGGWGVVGNLVPGFPTLGDLIVPAILVVIGLVFVRRGFGATPTR